jgi:serine/threonine-protein kinase
MNRSVRTLPSQVGRYQIVRALGRGAMGEVLLARDPVLDREIALKLLCDDPVLTHEQRSALNQRLEQEARAAARVSHPNLVALHDMGRDPIAGLFLVFEYVGGETLDARVTRGPLSASEAARLSRQLGLALAAAHAAHIIHRDVKPENVLLGRAGAKLADFGVAQLPDAAPLPPGCWLGTPAYSAPEAIAASSYSPESDQFSLACTLYEAISAQRAFPGDDTALVIERVRSTEPNTLAPSLGLSRRVDVVLARAFSKDPGARFASCEEFGDALADALEGASRPRLDRPRPARAGSRRASNVVGAALVILAVVAGAGLGYRGGAQARSGEPALSSVTLAAVPEPALRPVIWAEARARLPGSATTSGKVASSHAAVLDAAVLDAAVLDAAVLDAAAVDAAAGVPSHDAGQP